MYEKNVEILHDVISLITNVVDMAVFTEKGKGVLMPVRENDDGDSLENVEFFQEVTASIVIKKIRDKFKV